MVRKYKNISPVPSAPEYDSIQEEIPLKVTLLLPRDTLGIIDEFVRNAKVGSRGRLIQLLMDDVWQLQGEFKTMYDTITAYTQGTIKDPQFITFASIGMAGLIRRLGRYYPPPVSVQPPQNLPDQSTQIEESSTNE